jgi:hypothetical protein
MPMTQAHDDAQMAAVERILEAFVAESLPDGGLDRASSLWQTPGTGSGNDLFPGGVDVRYLRFLVEDLYRFARLTGQRAYHDAADAHARWMARITRADHPTWALGNALEMIGLYHAWNPAQPSLATAARQLVEWLRERRVRLTTADGVSFWHYPCGYGVLGAKDAGWTNDLSMVGSGLVWAYEVLGEDDILQDAISFAEYFVQPWRPDALGSDGYWHCGTWREDLGSWVVGPSHYSGFESTKAHGDEVSWVFSTETCTDYLVKLHRHHPDPRYMDRGVRAAQWTFDQCQFPDGAIGMCGRDDKWLGLTGHAVTQVAMLLPLLEGDFVRWRQPLLAGAEKALTYLRPRLVTAKLADHGVQWVQRTTSTDPLVNVGMLWAAAVLGWLNGRELAG